MVQSRSYLLLLIGLMLMNGRLCAQTPASQPAPRIISRATVFKYELSDPYDLKNLYGFNHAPSVVRLADDRLLAGWFSGPFEASVHQVILGSFSADQGVSWSAGSVLQDFPRKSDFDPAFIADGKRVWLFFSAGRWNRYPFVGSRKLEQQEVGVDSFRIWAKRSDDSGQSWSEPVAIHNETGVGCRSNGIKLLSGELLLPIHSFSAPHVAGVLKSTDEGKTWKRFGKISTPGKIGAAEPSIAELSGGRVLMALRSNDGFLWTVLSKDGGETWDPPHKTDMVAAGASHNLLALKDGHLVLTHCESAPPLRSPLTMRISADEGTTWGPPAVLAQVDPPTPDGHVWGRQVTYPSVIQLGDGTLVAVWAKIELSADSQSGIIESAKVRVDQ